MRYEKPEVSVVDFAAMERLASLQGVDSNLRLDGALEQTSAFTPVEGVEGRG
jgi:hypothetical protein